MEALTLDGRMLCTAEYFTAIRHRGLQPDATRKTGAPWNYSTLIVEDVSELCTRMAIIDKGEILLEAEPLRAVDALRGRVWRRTVTRDALAEVEQEHHVISTKLLAGRTIVHVYGDTAR
jgi:ABC-type multidrug transport system ATPase subunit